MIVRYVARFLLYPKSPWSLLIAAKYGSQMTCANIRTNRSSSFIWREINYRVIGVWAQIRWVVEDGRTTDFLYDAWFSDLPLSRWLTFISAKVGESMRIADLLCSERRDQCTDVMAQFFGPNLARTVLSLVVPIYDTCDVRLWRSSRRMREVVRDLYTMFSGVPTCRIDAAWIQRFGVHSRARLFFWKVTWGYLPIKSILRDRGVALPTTNSCCDVGEEKVGRAFFYYPRAMQIQG